MNLLGRIKESGLLVMAGLMLVWGCKEDLGIELPPDVQRTEVKVVELSLPITNVYFDSLRTDKAGVLVTGSFSDNIYGTISTKAFTEYIHKFGFVPEVDYRLITKGSKTDSLANFEFIGARLALAVDKVLSENTFLNQTIELRTLTDTIFSQGIYLSDRFIGEEDLIGTGFISISDVEDVNGTRPTIGEGTSKRPKPYVVHIPFTEQFARTLRLSEEGVSENIRRRGFSISTVESNGLTSFDLISDSTELQVLYKGKLYDNETNVFKKDTTFTMISFNLSQGNTFTQVIRDRSGSSSANVVDRSESSLSDDFVYFNELAGIYPTIDLSPFIEFAETEQGALINRATITIEAETNPINIPYMQSINYYFSKSESSVNVNWPSIFQAPGFYRTVLQNDSKYLSPNAQLSNVVHQIDTLSKAPLTFGYKGSPTIFWQYIYDNAIYDWDEVDLDKRPTMHQYLANVEKLIMMNSTRMSLGRTALKKDGIKLKIYYTKPRE